MTITRYPAMIVIEDDNHEDLAVVKMEDSGAALVTVNRVTNAREWRELSEQILGALRDMRLDGDTPD